MSELPDWRRAPGPRARLLGALALGNVLALLSVLVERRGPEQVAYGNLRGADTSQPCLEPALKGGFPFAYLTDVPGVSVEHRLSLEDVLDPAALGLDVAFYAAVVLGLLWLLARKTRAVSGP